MSKRIIALVLCAGMLLLGGCASEGATTAPPTTSSDVESQVESETVPPEESVAPTAEVEEPTEADEPEEITGIIAVVADWQTGMNFTIVSIDPDTGEQQTISYFDVLPLQKMAISTPSISNNQEHMPFATVPIGMRSRRTTARLQYTNSSSEQEKTMPDGWILMAVSLT